jgi:putative FmdB family regulatory protein
MTYEYTCEGCGHSWEAEQSIKDAPLKKCVSCGAAKAKRLVSGGTGFLLKGGGWYADGYGSAKSTSSEGKSETASTGESASSKPETKSDTKSDTSKEVAKPAEKATSDSSASKPTSAASTAS